MYDWILQEYQYVMNIIDISLICLIPSRNRLGLGREEFCVKQDKSGMEHLGFPPPPQAHCTHYCEGSVHNLKIR